MKRILTDRLFQGSLKLLGCSDIKLQTETDTNYNTYRFCI